MGDKGEQADSPAHHFQILNSTPEASFGDEILLRHIHAPGDQPEAEPGVAEARSLVAYQSDKRITLRAVGSRKVHPAIKVVVVESDPETAIEGDPSEVIEIRGNDNNNTYSGVVIGMVVEDGLVKSAQVKAGGMDMNQRVWLARFDSGGTPLDGDLIYQYTNYFRNGLFVGHDAPEDPEEYTPNWKDISYTTIGT